MPPRYFQGTSVLGSVKASAARSFREVVDVLRVCPSLAITRTAFLALDKKQRNEIKQVPFFVPACFTDSPSKRKLSHAEHCNLIFLDIDEMPDGRCPAAPFVNNPQTLYTALQGFNFAAHTTASSTPEKPRMRIVVDAEEIPLTSYVNAVGTIALMLGLPNLTKESKVAVQPMFLPTLFSDSRDDEHPLIAHHLEGRPFTVEDIAESLPSYTPFTPTSGTPTSLDALDFLRAPVPEITLQVAQEALSHVDSDSVYLEWLECAAALKHQFSPHQAEEAFTIFDEWSERGSKYGGESETRKKWDSLRPTPQGRTPVTIRTLLRSAVAGGWDDKRVKETIFSRLTRWFEEAESISTLIDFGAQKIVAAPLLSAVQEDVLVGQLVANAKKRFAYTITPTAIRKDIVRLRQEIKAQERAAETTKEPAWAKGVCYIAAASEFFRHRTGEKYRTESFNASYSRWLLPTEDYLKEQGIPVTPATLSKPTVLPSDYALNHLKIPTAYDYAYDPSQPNETFFVHRGRKYLNTYTDTCPELDHKHAPQAGAVFSQHLGHLIKEEEYRRTLTDFLAYMVQNPGRKIRWAVLLQSVEGAGKTYFAKVMQAVLGFEHVKILSDGAIKSGYNEWAFGHQLVAVEEIYASGPHRHGIMNTIKPLITNDDISLDEKYRSNRQAPNISNYMLFSNHHDALALTPGDRRYFVLKSPLQHKSQVQALGESYFQNLFTQLREQPGAMRAWLYNHQISPEFRADGHAPRTKYADELIHDTASDTAAAVRRLLIEADYPLLQYDIVSAKVLLDVLHLEEGLTRVTNQHLAQVLREEGFQQLNRTMVDGQRHYLWCRHGYNETSALETARERVAKNQKNLSMELLFSA